MVYKPGQIWACVQYRTIAEGAPLWTLIEMLKPPLPCMHHRNALSHGYVCIITKVKLALEYSTYRQLEHVKNAKHSLWCVTHDF